jgi:hypothetical protein
VSEIDSSEEIAARPPPTLSGYYSDPKMKPVRFLKAVRAAKTKAFRSDDIESAQAALVDRDPDLSRTLALGLGPNPPEPVDRWVIDVVRSDAGKICPNILMEEGASAEAIFEHLVNALTEALQSTQKPVQVRAQNLLRLSLIWLIRRRSLDPLRALYKLSGIFEISGKQREARQREAHLNARKVLLRATPSQWKILTVITNLSSEEVKEAVLSRDRAIQTRDQLKIRVAELEQAVKLKQEETDSLSRELQCLQIELTSERSELEDERRLRELDATEAAARIRNLLTGRLALLLSDARDALGFEPPHIEAARQRIDAARQTIFQETNNSNE